MNAIFSLANHPHGWHHAEFFFGVLLIIFMLYVPPKTIMQNIEGLHDFFEAHYGDTIGLLILFLAIALILVGDVWPSLTHAAATGNALLVAAMGVLKLTRPANGNGNHEPNPQPSIPVPDPLPPVAAVSAPAPEAPKT